MSLVPYIRRRRIGGVAASAFAAYAANSITPELVADFAAATEFYGYDSAASTFDAMMTVSTTGLETMVDSAGNLVWNPHNLSRDFTTLTGGEADPEGGTSARLLDGESGTTNNITYFLGLKLKVMLWVKAGTADAIAIGQARSDAGINEYHLFTASTGVLSLVGTHASNPVVADIGGGWFKLSYDWEAISGNQTFGNMIVRTDGVVGSDNGTYYLYGMHQIRNDLGGMADNPDAAAGFETYVTTTSAAVYLPRRNAYYGPAPAKGGLRFESSAATNLITSSSNLVTAGTDWSAGLEVLTQDETGPDGVANSATTLTDDNSGGTGAPNIQQVLAGLSTSTAYTASFYAKADQLNFAQIRVSNSSASDGRTYFNLSTGAVATTDADHTATIEDVGGGFYRCAITFLTDVADTTLTISFSPAEVSGTSTVDLDSTSSIIMYGPQFEAGSVPSSYMPTNGASVTRPLETLSLVSSKTPVNTTAFSISFSGLLTYADTNQGLGNSGGVGEALFYEQHVSASSYFEAGVSGNGSATGNPVFAQESSATRDIMIGDFDQWSPGINVPMNVAARHTSTAINGAIDGTALAGNLTPVILDDYSSVPLGIATIYNGFISEVIVWGADIGDTGIAEAST